MASSGTASKQQGLEEMRAAKAAADATAGSEYASKPKGTLEREGKMEKGVGGGVGCGGLEQRGDEKLRAAGDKVE